MTVLPDFWAELHSNDKKILLLIAVAPPPVSIDVLIEISNFSAVEVLKILNRLEDQSAIRVSDTKGSGFYQLSDPGLAKAVIKKSNPKIVKTIATDLVAFIGRKFEDGPEKWMALTQIHHLAALETKNVDTILKSAQYCLTQRQPEAAADYFNMVIENLPIPCRQTKDKMAYIDACLGILSAHGRLMPLAEQKSLMRRSVRYAQQIKDPARQVRTQIILARIYNYEGDYQKAAKFYSEGWKIAQKLGQENILKWAAIFTTDFLFWQGRVSDAVQRYEQVIGNLEELSSDPAVLRACASLGWCYGICGQTSRGIGLIEAVRRKADALQLKKVRIYTDMMSMLTLLDVRRIAEAKVFLDNVLRLPEEELGHRVLWATRAAMAYVHFIHGDLAACYNMQKLAVASSTKLGWPHHHGPWNFEYLDGLEEAGFIHPEMNYESEVRRVLNWPDIYMQGIGLRYRAQRAFKRSDEESKIREDLKKSIHLLTRSGAKLELSHAQILMARLLLKKGQKRPAQRLLNKAWKVFSAVNENLFPADLRSYVIEESLEKMLVRTVVEVGNAFGSVRRKQPLLEQIINFAMRLMQAERGGFFELKENGEIELVASRNMDKAMIQATTFEADYEIIRQVARSGEVITNSGDTDPTNGNMSSQRSSSWICSPVMLRNRILGVFYLDSSVGNLALADKELLMFKAISNQAAVALDNVRAYGEIAKLRDRLAEETRIYREKLESPPQFGQFIGHSPAIRQVFRQIQKVAATETTVLLTGETGVGKELAARAIHRLSSRSQGSFIPVNTASLAQGLIASELFGHERGAFTGAVKEHLGRFELANGGTLFLDDIEAIPLEIQVKLLRTIQEKEFERVGGNSIMKSDFRLITATNQNLEEMVQKGTFRADLYYRLNVFPINIPPLRERKEDIPLLATHFFKAFKASMGKSIKSISDIGIKNLSAYSWPGNVRELQHVIERSLILSNGNSLKIPALDECLALDDDGEKFKTFEEMERSYIIEALKRCNWQVSGKDGAAKMLDLKTSTLNSKMKRLGISKNVHYSVT